MRILFFSVANGDGLSQQLESIERLHCEITRIHTPDDFKKITVDYDLGLSDRCNFLIPSEIIKHTRLGIFNFHPSLLPNHSGSYSQFWSLIHNDPYGVTCHRIDNKLDTGPVIDTVPIPYTSSETFSEMYRITRFVTESMQWRLLNEARKGTIPIGTAQVLVANQKHHRSSQTKPLLSKLKNSWDTKISDAREQLKGIIDINGRTIRSDMQ